MKLLLQMIFLMFLFLIIKIFFSLPHVSLLLKHLFINLFSILSLLNLLIQSSFHFFFCLKLQSLFHFFISQILIFFLSDVILNHLIFSIRSLIHLFDHSLSHSILIFFLSLLSLLILFYSVPLLLLKYLNIRLLNCDVFVFLSDSILLFSLLEHFTSFHHISHLVFLFLLLFHLFQSFHLELDLNLSDLSIFKLFVSVFIDLFFILLQSQLLVS